MPDPEAARVPEGGALPGLVRLAHVMHAIRVGCPWDAEQTHASLVRYLVEETAEVVEAIEAGEDDQLREELGDLLLQVYFHAEIAAEEGRFTLDDVASEIAAKLVARHPYVFAGADVPDDVLGSWERRKRVEKARASALDGIPGPLDTLARAAKVVSRVRAHGIEMELPADPVTPDELGGALLTLVARAQASGIDADQALRGVLRRLETHIRAVEPPSS